MDTTQTTQKPTTIESVVAQAIERQSATRDPLANALFQHTAALRALSEATKMEDATRALRARLVVALESLIADPNRLDIDSDNATTRASGLVQDAQDAIERAISEMHDEIAALTKTTMHALDDAATTRVALREALDTVHAALSEEKEALADL
mgnify:CR=1 FL=1